jgi:hypothetical protein
MKMTFPLFESQFSRATTSNNDKLVHLSFCYTFFFLTKHNNAMALGGFFKRVRVSVEIVSFLTNTYTTAKQYYEGSVLEGEGLYFMQTGMLVSVLENSAERTARLQKKS